MYKNKKKVQKNVLVTMIVLFFLIIFSPLFPYRHPLFFSEPNYIEIKTKYSSQDGLVLTERCEELNLEKGMEVGNRLIGLDKITNEITSIKYGLPGNKINIYGSVVESANGKRMFQIENWSSSNTMIIETYIWDEKISKLYGIIFVLSIISIIICAVKLIKINKKKV